MRHRKNLIAILGGDVTKTLFGMIHTGIIGKVDLRRLAEEVELSPIYFAYKDKDPFDEDVATEMFSSLLDKDCITNYIVVHFINVMTIFSVV